MNPDATEAGPGSPASTIIPEPPMASEHLRSYGPCVLACSDPCPYRVCWAGGSEVPR
jgi:hypothetical protein